MLYYKISINFKKKKNEEESRTYYPGNREKNSYFNKIKRERKRYVITM